MIPEAVFADEVGGFAVAWHGHHLGHHLFLGLRPLVVIVLSFGQLLDEEHC